MGTNLRFCMSFAFHQAMGENHSSPSPPDTRLFDIIKAAPLQMSDEFPRLIAFFNGVRTEHSRLDHEIRRRSMYCSSIALHYILWERCSSIFSFQLLAASKMASKATITALDFWQNHCCLHENAHACIHAILQTFFIDTSYPRKEEIE